MLKGFNVVIDGMAQHTDLKVPVGNKSGIKIFINPGLVVNGGLSADLLLDFGCKQSFVAQGAAVI